MAYVSNLDANLVVTFYCLFYNGTSGIFLSNKLDLMSTIH